MNITLKLTVTDLLMITSVQHLVHVKLSMSRFLLESRRRCRECIVRDFDDSDDRFFLESRHFDLYGSYHFIHFALKLKDGAWLAESSLSRSVAR